MQAHIELAILDHNYNIYQLGSDYYTGDGGTGDRGMGDDVAKCQSARGSGSMLTIDVFLLDNLNNAGGRNL